MSINMGEVKYEPNAAGDVSGRVTQSDQPVQQGGSALDRLLDGIASKGQELTGQGQSQGEPSKGGSALDRALDGLADAGREIGQGLAR